MRLLKLQLENFRQHRRTEIVFEPGMTAIVGPNGSGKSTILEGISYALYGEYRGKIESLRFYRATEKRVSATLSFELGDRRYEVRRTADDAWIKDITNEGVSLAVGKTETALHCAKLLRLNHKQFINSFCAEQKGLAFLAFRGDTGRQMEIARMLGYDRLKNAEDRASDRRKTTAAMREGIRQGQSDLNELERAKTDSIARKTQAAKELKEATLEGKRLEKELGPARALAMRAVEWQTLTQEMTALDAAKKGLESNVETCRAHHQALQSDRAELERLASVEGQIRAAREQLAAMSAAFEQHVRRQGFEREIESCEKDLAVTIQQLEAIVAPDLKAIEKELADAIAEHARAKTALSEQSSEWQRLRRESELQVGATRERATLALKTFERASTLAEQGICPECEQPIAKDYGAIVAAHEASLRESMDAHETAKQRSVSLAEKPKALVEAETALDAALLRHNHAQSADAEARSQAKEIARLSQSRASAEANIARLRKELGALDFQFDPAAKQSVEKLIEELEPRERRRIQLLDSPKKLAASETALANATKELEATTARRGELMAQRKKLNIDDAAAAIEEARALEERLRANVQQISHLKTTQAMADQEVQRSEERIRQYRHNEQQIAELGKREALNATAATELKQLRLSLNRDLKPDLEARASENLCLLTNGRYDRIQLDDQFNPSLLEDGEISKNVISGGEEDVVALSLRLALSELIQERRGQPMSLLILDEVFGSLDVERRGSVLDRLLALKDRFEQILVISHIEEINQVADHCLFLTRDEETTATQVSDVPPFDEAGWAEIQGAFESPSG